MAPPKFTYLKVLVVDDHFSARQIVINVLRQNGVTNIETASNGAEAKDMIYGAHHARVPFHIVFLDWNMPVMSGFEVLQHFREQPAYALTAFIMLTAEAEQAEVLKAVKAGATTYIVKPVSQLNIEKKFFEVVEWVKTKNPAIMDGPKPLR
jgi:two-component system chemotaxis response regulator CheY